MVWEKTLPICATVDYFVNATVSNAKSVSDLLVGQSRAQRANIEALRIGELTVAIALTTVNGVPRSAECIMNIVALRSWLQMCRIAAARIVAHMAKHRVSRQCAMVNCPAQPMRPLVRATASRLAMAEVMLCAEPRPAIVGAFLVDQTPEACDDLFIHERPLVGRARATSNRAGLFARV